MLPNHKMPRIMEFKINIIPIKIDLIKFEVSKLFKIKYKLVINKPKHKIQINIIITYKVGFFFIFKSPINKEKSFVINKTK